MANNEQSGDVLPSGPRASAEEFDRLVAEYLGRLNDGERLDRARILADHPELGEEILGELETFAELCTGDDNEPLGSLGDYTLHRQIGRGGMGVVYEAWENSMNRSVALKVLPAGIAADRKAYTRFMREAQAAGQLNHPNLVPVHAAGFKESTPYYAMELIEGETLAQIIPRLKDAETESETVFGHKGSAPYFDKLARAFADVADGLQHAHSKGVTHRDIKPSNLILDQEGRLRILDFGLARLEGQESLTISGDLIGTPLYMSPEQARQRKIRVDHRTDVYSLGATMYEALTNCPPFQGKDHQDTLSQIIERDPIEPRRFNPRVPKDLETIVLKCLRKDATDRYGTAEALAQDLRRFVRGDPIEARPQSGWERLRRRAWSSRGRILTTILCSLLVLTLAVLGASYLRERERKRASDYDDLVHSAIPPLHLGLVTLRRGGGIADKRSDFSLAFRGNARALGAADPVTQALETLERASSLLPERPEAHYFRARGFWLLGREAEALREIEEALALNPGFAPAVALKEALGGEPRDRGDADKSEWPDSHLPEWAVHWLRGRAAVEAGRWGEAIDAYDLLIEREASKDEPFAGFSMEVRLGRGIARMGAGHYTAIGDFAVAESKWPGAPAPSLLLAQACLEMGHEKDAVDLYEKTWKTTAFKDEVALEAALTLGYFGRFRPRLIRALEWADRMTSSAIRERLRASFLCFMKRQEEAESVVETLDDVDPFSAAWGGLVCAWNPDKRGAALEKARTALESAARNPYVLYLAGWTYDILRIGPLALDCLQQADKLDPGFSLPSYAHALSLMLQGRIADATDRFREHLRRFPTRNYFGHYGLAECHLRDDKLEAALGEARQAVELDPEFVWGYRTLGRIEAKFGRTVEAEVAFRKAIDCSAVWWQHVERRDLARFLLDQGRYDEALEEIRLALASSPGYRRVHEVLSNALRMKPEGDDWPGLVGIIRILEEAWDEGMRSPYLVKNLVSAHLLSGADERFENALLYATSWVDEAATPDANRLATVASVHQARGQQREALALLESAHNLVSFTKAHAAQLRQLRSHFLPDLPTYGSVDQALADSSHAGEDAKILSGFLEASGGKSKHLRLYVEGRMLQRTAEPAKAAGVFKQLVALDPDSPEGTLRLAECLRAAGDPGRAERLLRGVLSRHDEDRELWDLWLALSFVELERTAASVLDACPVGENYGEDVRWLLAQLAGDVIRINCGGDAYRNRGETTWGRDRFFRGGQVADPAYTDIGMEVDGTEDPELFWSSRRFARDCVRPAYRVPLPPGEYRVTLHFAETLFGVTDGRAFDVVVEGRQVLSDYAPEVRRARSEDVRTRVDDGFLDMEFLQGAAGLPMISAIEIKVSD